jgi:hypothetical protein
MNLLLLFDQKTKKTLMRVQGILHPTSHVTVNENTRSDLLDAIYQNGLLLWSQDGGLWTHGIIDINTCLPAAGGQKVAMDFLSNIKNLVNAERVEPLGLSGVFVITVDADAEPVNLRATVESGEVRYQQATLIWENEEVLS